MSENQTDAHADQHTDIDTVAGPGRARAGEHGRRPPAGHRTPTAEPPAIGELLDDEAIEDGNADEYPAEFVDAGEFDGPVIDAEVIDDQDHDQPDQPDQAGAELVPARGPLRRAGGATARQAVHLVTTARAVAVHPRTRTGVRAAARHGWYPLAGTVVVAKRWRDAHGANRYERMMRAAEVAGDREAVLEWEARDVAEKQRRHDRVMDWIASPLQLVKAGALALAAVTFLLLGLGIILAAADSDITRVLDPIIGVIEAIRWTAWFLTAYGALLLLAATAGAVAYVWNVGRLHTEPPAWAAPGTGEQGIGRDVVPDEGAILQALRNLSLSALDRKFKEGWSPRWVLGTGRDGKGWRTQLELPPGVTVEMINGKRDVLAHNLVRLPVEVWPTEPKRQPGVLDLWVADQGLLTGPVEAYPLLHKGATDYFRGVPAGIDQRGDVVTGKLMGSNYAIAGTMGSGKTSLVVELLCGAMLDPLVDIEVYAMAYNVDYDPMRARLSTLVKGDEDEHVIAAMDALRALRTEVTQRGRILAELGGEETKVTRQLAARDARLRPRVVVFDECQELFRHPQFGGEAKELAIKVMMKARKCAITLVFVTPAPSADSLPRDLAKTASHRVCFAIGDHAGNDAILGTGAHRQGVSATHLVPGEDVGTAMAAGFSTRPGLLRTHHIRREAGIDEITPITKRAVAAREAADLPAAPDQTADEVEVLDPLADIAAVLRGHDRMRTQEVLSLLAGHNRAAYGAWTFSDLRVALPDGAKPYKSGGVQVIATARVTEALADRDITPDDADPPDDPDGVDTDGDQ